MVRADLVTSVALLALGVATMVASRLMPRFADQGADPWSAPGVTPGLLGAALTLLAAILFLRSVAALRRPAEVPAEGTAEEAAEAAAGEAAQGGWGRAALAAGLCILYAAGLVGRMPFWLATFVFVFAFVAVFELWGVEPRPPLGRVLLAAAAVAAGSAAVIPYVFQTIFLVRLP